MFTVKAPNTARLLRDVLARTQGNDHRTILVSLYFTIDNSARERITIPGILRDPNGRHGSDNIVTELTVTVEPHRSDSSLLEVIVTCDNGEEWTWEPLHTEVWEEALMSDGIYVGANPAKYLQDWPTNKYRFPTCIGVPNAHAEWERRYPNYNDKVEEWEALTMQTVWDAHAESYPELPSYELTDEMLMYEVD